MSKLEFKELVPELRFSQFIGGTEWQKKPFNKLYSLKVTNSLSRDKLNYDDGIVKNIHYGDIHTKFSTLFDITKENVPFINTEISLDKVKEESYCLERDMVFADASEDIDDVGKSIELINLNGEKLLSGLHTILARPKKNDLVKGFGGYLFKSEVMRKQIQKESQGAKVLGISGSRISNVEVIYPIDHDEQQKIADCLSSMDDLIIINTKKLESLKLHKKGLMQKLFPTEGKSVPEYRINGSRENWIEKELKDITSSVFDGTHQTPKYTEDGVPFFSVENIVSNKDNKFISIDDYNLATVKNKPELDDILITRIGKIGFTKVVDWSYDFSIYVTLAVIKNDKRFNSKYLHSYMQSERFQNELQRRSLLNAVPCKINMDELRKSKVMLPLDMDEQNRIADCLFSLEEIIESQSNKIEILKKYKKGLMQKLFPENKESIA
ncbi:restriction endonuclease subunit S [Vibrio aestuarianus]|uniref:restriction endonuclease subunit S n=2 Tax=Vibrio aestuarianus TaxID=28171 RepID=UPI0014489C3B|nr:restriction endonuclease subunit S [Vibrio aestuarianus]MDE1212337.1 restriction endonuclease subunit S [Vibrio aestuarianus]MDE1259463.1 restriction endonuclease subunit S [Vibrio aestuarianus]MDE1269105.1 restriction endonuclease subunit S [Vibrio aestuarianus]MDE1273707.1 restriction endonuclease subunit S [Vibrio aestuarianus]MDE1281004.1 restriction endonuclease subunit S [Vibrio aestuarianus]